MLFASPFIFMPNKIDESWLNFYSRYCISQCVILLIFYINYFVLINKYLFKKNVKKFLLANMVMIIVSAAFMYIIDTYFWVAPSSDNFQKPSIHYEWLLHLIRDITMYILTAGLSVGIKMTIRWYIDESRKKDLEKIHAEAELKNLKSQLNPHFLFNTLNNIYSLIAINQDDAQEAVHQLSKMLRYVLYDNNQIEVPVAQEIDFIESYLNLVKLRFSSKVDISFNVKGDNKNMVVAPLLFVTLIENAFKHGISNTGKSFVHILLDISDNDKLMFTTENSFFPKGENDKSGSGIGLENLKKRLSLIYKKDFSFSSGRENDIFLAKLTIGKRKTNIPLKEN